MTFCFIASYPGGGFVPVAGCRAFTAAGAARSGIVPSPVAAAGKMVYQAVAGLDEQPLDTA